MMITHSEGASGVGSVIDIEMVVTVDVESLKLEKELLKDALRLEGKDAVLVPLVLAIQHHAVHCPGDAGHKVPLPRLVADLPH